MDDEVDAEPVVDGWGIDRGYHGTDGAWHETLPATRAALRAAMGAVAGEHGPPPGPPVWIVPEGWGEQLLGRCRLVLEDGTDVGVHVDLPPDLPIGRHRLIPIDGGPTTLLMVRPRGCHHPRRLRVSALAVQAYAARSSRSWGIGDFADLRLLGSWAHEQGIDLLALSPMHAPTPAPRPQASPYYPSSRRRLNPLHLCIDEVPGAAVDHRVLELGNRARHLLTDRLIDRAAVWAAKSEALERLFAARGTAIDLEVRAFRAREGEDLERWATFCALAEVHAGPWQDWPEALRHPASPAVEEFTRDNADRVRYHCWLQWLADRQIRELGAAMPLVTDLAVGVDPGGADAWTDQDLLALDARIGAPPDDFAPDGQDWGLPPYIPHRLQAEGYESFARSLRTSMRYGSGIRIDHVLGLFRLFWVPCEGSPATGAYVRYRAEELLAVLAIESTRAGTFVIGEDLGTVEAGVREALADVGVLSTRLVWFEDRSPAKWPAAVAGAVTTHDLPTIAGAWTGADGRARLEAGLDDPAGTTLRSRLEPIAATLDTAGPPTVRDIVAGAHGLVSRSPVEVAIGSLDDVLCVEERPNMPGTIDEWPNWRLALPTLLDDLVTSPVPPTLSALVRPTRR